MSPGPDTDVTIQDGSEFHGLITLDEKKYLR